MNQHLSRWIAASITKHFETRAQGLPIYVEGYDRTKNPKNSLELRFNGPNFDEPSNNYFVIDVDINVLVTTIKDERDAHKSHKNVGVAVAAFTTEIPVYKYGNSTDDDRTILVGCLIVQKPGIIVTNFGLVQDSIMMSTVEALYQMVLN